MAGQYVLSCQVVTNPFCCLAVIFCGFIDLASDWSGNNKHSRIFAGDHNYTGKTVNACIYESMILER